jgi:hypothetical protein
MDIKEVFREADGSTVPLEIDSTDGSLYADGVKYKIGEAKEIDPEAEGFDTNKRIRLGWYLR